jgi:hypothetical protein
MLKIELIKEVKKNCYFEKYYKLTTDFELTENQLEHLRQAGFLSHGQIFGKVIKEYKEDQDFIYELKTIRDSGD